MNGKTGNATGVAPVSKWKLVAALAVASFVLVALLVIGFTTHSKLKLGCPRLSVEFVLATYFFR